MKRMYSNGAQDLKFDSKPWSHTVDLINNAVGLRAVGSADIVWSDGTNKFFYCKGGSAANRFQGGIRVQSFVGGGFWTDIKKTDFGAGAYPAVGANTEVIIDLGSEDTVSIPDDAFVISSKNMSGESTLAIVNWEAGETIHKISYATKLNMNMNFDAQDFINQIKNWYRQKGWIETVDGSEYIVIPSKYVSVGSTLVSVKEEALPPELRINYSDGPINHIYVLPRTIVIPK